MNKTAAVIAFSVLAALGVVGAVIIILYRPESIGTLTGFIITILGLATTAIVTFYSLGKVNEKVDTVVTQTNGINTALRDQLEAANTKIAELSRELPPAP